MKFWGVQVKPKKGLKCTPPQNRLMHLTKAVLESTLHGISKKSIGKVNLYFIHRDRMVPLGCLSRDNPDMSLDLEFNEDFVLCHTSKDFAVNFFGVYESNEIDKLVEDSHDGGVGYDGVGHGGEETPHKAATTAMDQDAVAKAFVVHYYQTFDDTSRAALGNLYQDSSLLTFNGEKFKGPAAIFGKITSVLQCKHNVSTINYQPSGEAGGMLVFVWGSLQLTGEQPCAFEFHQIFHLMPTPQGSFYVQNDMIQVGSAMNPDEVAKAFVTYYYQTFDANKVAFGKLYQDSSLLHFNGEKFEGLAAILGKYTSMVPCKKDNVEVIDWQPSGVADGVLVFVRGKFQLTDEPRQCGFYQIFHLMPTPQGSLYVQNDIIRLDYAEKEVDC